jgi:C4-dicarboxylate transporter DctQ subunit
LFVLLSLFGSAVAAKRRAHLGLTILTDRLPWRINKFIFAFGYACAAVFCAILVWKGIDMVKTSLRFKTVTLAMNWPEWIFNSFVPIGGAVIGIRYVQLFFLTLALAEDPKAKTEENRGSADV